MDPETPRPELMDPAGHAVVEDSARPTMPPVDSEAEPDERMPDPPTDTDDAADEWGGFDDAVADDEVPDGDVGELPDMEPLDALHPPAPPSGGDATTFAAPVSGEGYVRLLCEVTGDDLRIVGASVVDGPLIRPELTGHLAYQVLVHGRVIAAGAFDDLTHQRGIAPPDHPELGHSTTRLETYQFTVRIPRAELQIEDLDAVEIELVRPATTTELADDAARTPGAGFAAAATDAGHEPPQLVARLTSLDAAMLPDEVVTQLREDPIGDP
jgi:hypothetical protein